MEIFWKPWDLYGLRCLYFTIIVSTSLFNSSLSQDSGELPTSVPGLPTVTVRGFLNFRTTVDGTVIVFTPASEIHHPPTLSQNTKTTSNLFHSSAAPSAIFISNDDLREKELGDGVQDLSYTSPPQNRLEPISTQQPTLNEMENKIKESFLHHISDNAVLPSTDQENNNLEKAKKAQESLNQFPTGLVTVLGGTFVDADSKTLLETKVIGTYIEGKYAQILQSTSRILPEVRPSLVTPILSYSTVDRSHSKESEPSSSNLSLLSTFSSSITTISPAVVPISSVISKPSISSKSVTASQSSRKPSILIVPSVSPMISPFPSATRQSAPFLNSQLLKTPIIVEASVPTPNSLHVLEKNRISSHVEKTVVQMSSSKPNSDHFVSYKDFTTVLESSFVEKSASPTFDNDGPTESLENVLKKTSGYKFSFQPVTTTVLKTVDHRTIPTNQKNGGSTSRTRFHSPRRPSQSVRLNRFKVKLTLRQDTADDDVTSTTDEEELEEEQHHHKFDDDMELVTEGQGFGAGVDPAKVVFQETTIVSEVTLHVGRRKSVRTLTITTSVPLTIHPSEIPEILAAQSSSMDREASNQNHIATRTFTTTERAIKTSVVPVFDGKSTAYHTITESFFILKLITAYRTLTPREASILESAFEEPEIAATTLEAAANFPPSTFQTVLPGQFVDEDSIKPSINLPATADSYQPLTNPFLPLGHALSNNPLAAVYLGLQQLNAHMTLYSTLTDTSTYVTTETIYATKSIKFYDGRSTRYRTVSDPISTKKRTVTTTLISLQPYLNTQALQQQEQLQKLVAVTRHEPQFSTMTSTYETVTTTTSLSTRVYTLIYNGFSTKLRTVTSTSTYPATITVTSTKRVPLLPTNIHYPY